MKTKLCRLAAWLPLVSAFFILPSAFFAPSAFASLTAIVTPGYQFPIDGSVPPTYPLLNQLAIPDISIVGTIGGSNTLAPGSVTGVSLADTLPEGGVLSLPVLQTIGWTANSPRQLAVNVPGLVNGLGGITAIVSSNQLYLNVDPSEFLLVTNSYNNTNSSFNTGSTLTNWLTLKPGGLAGNLITTNGQENVGSLSVPFPLVGGGALVGSLTNSANTNGYGAVIYVQPQQLAIYNDINVVSNAANTGTLTNTGPTLHLLHFTSPLFAVGSSYNYWTNVPHYLGATPSQVRCVLVCQTADQGYPPGFELPYLSSDDNPPLVGAPWGADATNVWAYLPVSQNDAMKISTAGNNSKVSLNLANWRLKIYARP
jgi:hypothetical protein